MLLSVIIVNYNVKYFLEQCLHSVLRASKNIDAEIIVVDNASHDDSLEYLQPKFSSVNFISNKKNIGFAKANNIALKQAKGEYVLFLNPDTIISENSLQYCIQFMRKNRSAGAVGLKMIDGSGNFLPESKRALPSLMSSFFKLSGMAKIFLHSKIFNRYALGNLSENKIHKVEVLPGAFFFSSKKILDSINGLDEDFFMYGEDIDLSYRIIKKGFYNYYVGIEAIVHFKGESTQKNNYSYAKNFYTAMNIFVQKHYSFVNTVAIKPLITLAKIFSFMIHSIKHSSSTAVKRKPKHFILIGDNADTVNAKKILSNLNHTFETFVSIDALKSSQQNNVIFCIGKLNYADSIQFIQNNKNRFSYYWHAALSGSIIGSEHSNNTGEIYVLE